MVGSLTGFYSRRINIQHRLVYEVYSDEIIENGIAYEGVVKVAHMWTHYEGIK
ncbi:type II toxin-antitoxin system YoeB family toxin [Lachnoanaerobaculum umeaense]|uniref:type II toxin-antitoxin system YoeB family toxin n=1 Tax=Lachnoanaerobaculum umeaense TaxID=617123 RepID=UPI002E8E357F|nr:type II toxin-antitoxin system YoeB family toxin [Lachnoanaerobaculum umeaense]